MDSQIRRFIERSPLLFIASRNAEGALDISPRGGQPSVARVSDAGAILLPDYMGNKRLDTIGNILAAPEIGLMFVARGQNRVLRLRAKARVSTEAADLATFPADELPLMSVLILSPLAAEFTESSAFDRAGFWIDPSQRKPAMDLLGALLQDFDQLKGAGQSPVHKPTEEETLIAQSGLRAHYGGSSDLVRNKVYATAGGNTAAFIAEAGFVVIARYDAQGAIHMDLTGEGPLSPDLQSNSAAYGLRLPPEALGPPLAERQEIAVMASQPGRPEILRMNGHYTARDGGADLRITPQEIFFHCPLALSRSRVWMKDQTLPWAGRRRFTCVSRRIESPDVMSFVLRPEDSAALPAITAGQYVTLSLPQDPVDPPRRRSYSVVAQPDPHHLQIAVRRLGAEGLSDLLHNALTPGQTVLVGVPAGHFTLAAPSARPTVLISAGVGITPLLPMLRDLAQQAGPPVWFIHAARDQHHHLFASEVRDIAAQAAREIHILSAYSRAGDAQSCDLRGRISVAQLAHRLPLAQADVYICGPDAFMADLRKDLIAQGLPPDQIRTEAFLDQAGPLEDIAGLAQGQKPAKIALQRSKLVLDWAPKDGSLLDLLIAHQVKVSYSCRMGDCQSCLQKLLTGQTLSLPDTEVSEGHVLLCQAVPCGDLALDL